MLKREIERHNSATANKQLMQQMFSSSPPVAARQGKESSPTRPLRSTSGNAFAKPPAFAGFHNPNVGIKRHSSGLAKALPASDGFGDRASINSRHNPILLDTPRKMQQGLGTFDGAYDAGVYFDENDFDSDPDLDLEIETPGTKGQISYPKLPVEKSTAAQPSTRLNMTPTLPRPQTASTAATFDSGYESQRLPPQTSPKDIRSTPNSQILPWSSSPAEQFQAHPQRSKTPLWDKYAHSGQGARPKQATVLSSRNVKATYRSEGHFKPPPTTITLDDDGEVDVDPRPKKKRTLPWLDQANEPLLDLAAATPANKRKKDLPWNASVSAMKEQQKQLRQASKTQASKRLVKDNEATTGDRKSAVAAQKTKTLHRVFLSEEQQHVLQLVTEEKKSVFFTGSAGTGKSVLLREIIAALRKKYLREPDRIAVTASTGLAACNIGGVTLHSFAGIGLGKEDVATLCKKIRRNQKAKHRWMRTKVLVIDEVSMVDGELFDKLEEIARILRNNGRPFGGIQVVITGDFFQLPPVPDYGGRASKFAFDANTWKTSIDHTIALHHVFRQKDPEFAAMLNEMREGRLSAQSIARFRSLNRDLRFEDTLEATELFPTRNEVERANTQRMQNLQGELRIFEARDGGSIVDKTQRDKLLANCMAPEMIQLKKGAQVMLIKNIDETLVNGSLGKVIGFMSEAMFDNYQRNEEEYYSTQGAGAEADEAGGPSLSERKLKLQELAAGSGQSFPLVRFAIADGSTRDLLCQRESWKVELPNGEVQASRSQIPLILAWALSIHKAQGQTLERVKVDLGKVFEKGQAYVALSRATSMKGLQVVGFSASKIMAHQRVRDFYAGLSKIEAAGQKYDASVRNGIKKDGKGKAASEYEKEFVGGDKVGGEEDFEWDL